MFDLKERAESEWASVPIPLPGRVMMFAGPGGVPMARKADGTINTLTKAARIAAPSMVQTQSLQTLCSVSIENMVAGDCIELVSVFDITSFGPVPLFTMEVWVDGSNSSGAAYFNGLQVQASTNELRVALTKRNGPWRVAASVTNSSGLPSFAAGAIPAGKLATIKIKLVQASGSSIPMCSFGPIRVQTL